MTNKDKQSKQDEELKVDPFDELNEYDEELTIETEKDFFDELEQSDLDEVPEYDSESGTIIEGSEVNKQIKTKENNVVNEKTSLIETVEEVDVNNTNLQESNDKSESELSAKTKPKKKSSMPKPNSRPKGLKSKKLPDDTHIIDNVKVDDEGVPLLNQFDTEKIKESSFFPKITIKKVSLYKIFMIVLGLIISIYGAYQAMNEVVRISDHVMYGEHESIAMGLIFLGIIIIILAFYKEIMKIAGLNNLTTVMDDIDSSSNIDDEDKKSNK